MKSKQQSHPMEDDRMERFLEQKHFGDACIMISIDRASFWFYIEALHILTLF